MDAVITTADQYHKSLNRELPLAVTLVSQVQDGWWLAELNSPLAVDDSQEATKFLLVTEAWREVHLVPKARDVPANVYWISEREFFSKEQVFIQQERYVAKVTLDVL